jgi:hypothetical protein
MNKPLAIRATYSDWRLIKTRGVVQVVMEVPLADADAAYDVLGGMPNPANERWFGIAPIKEVMPNTSSKPAVDARPEPKQDKPARAKREWRDLPPDMQAGIRCNDPAFSAFLCEEHPDDWHESMGSVDECVRLICGVTSRAELVTHHRARVLWNQLDEQFLTQKALERAS